MSPVRPSLRVEKSHFAAGRLTVIGVDEVGRGAIAGPVAVGASAVTIDVRRVPQGLADSKLLSAARRTELVPVVTRWARTAVGMAPASYVDEQGIVPALGLAGARALASLGEAGVSFAGAVVILDGSFDWLSRAMPPSLLAGGAPAVGADAPLEVVVRVKADRDCASVAAASVVAKVERDALMVAAHDEAPHYAWASNKGYGSRAHYAAIREVGAHALHRTSWLHAAAAPTTVELDGFADLEQVTG
ncbi:ribonuclease HII [Curtobacterium sp. MCBA15_001]|uniref:ribonuclease HII n=1 Tax=Curtobacterium sp. MCBA15_001 TaxID=1898731 RepID=UPI0008DD5BF3|nr:ribonuclease HII [Curtobacterium sp. MCBA15_001]OIH93381.1 ribonuclease HII [Curtobacterium sp. MCBA15_001]